jgi:hypothetical protein
MPTPSPLRGGGKGGVGCFFAVAGPRSLRVALASPGPMIPETVLLEAPHQGGGEGNAKAFVYSSQLQKKCRLRFKSVWFRRAKMEAR